MKKLRISPPKNKNIKGEITLNGSKSIANRILIIKALCEDNFSIENLSNAKDTQTLKSILDNLTTNIDAKEGGTTYRFLTAFLATKNKAFQLTGSERMKQRPIGVLVDALRQLNVRVSYLEKEGFPPLEIDGSNITGGEIEVKANISSQYLSALLLIAPTLKGGLTLSWKGDLVSRPYILMTLNLMAAYGAKWTWNDKSITVEQGKYIAKDFYVEGDWSAASYYYSIAALADKADITLKGLLKNSVQGDAVIAKMLDLLLVSSNYQENEKKVTINKSQLAQPSGYYYDFIECPDLAQTIVSLLTGLNIPLEAKGLKTLKIKETDRVEALKIELGKLGADFKEIDSENWSLGFKEDFNLKETPEIATYEDHRMAMAIAPLCLVFGPIIFEEPDVVSKSYPNFWKDLESLGFEVDYI